jgi:hypothetical protein
VLDLAAGRRCRTTATTATPTMTASTMATAPQWSLRKFWMLLCQFATASVTGSPVSRTSTCQKYHSRYRPESSTKAPASISTYCIPERNTFSRPTLATARVTVSAVMSSAMPRPYATTLATPAT